jgi:hypothetical protein
MSRFERINQSLQSFKKQNKLLTTNLFLKIFESKYAGKPLEESYFDRISRE